MKTGIKEKNILNLWVVIYYGLLLKVCTSVLLTLLDVSKSKPGHGQSIKAHNAYRALSCITCSMTQILDGSDYMIEKLQYVLSGSKKLLTEV